MRRHVKKVFAVLMLTVAAFSQVVGQGNYTLYHMKTIPQRIYTNPARQSDAKNFLAMPGISSVYLNFSNTAFSLNTIFSVIENNPTDGTSVINLNKVGDIFQKTDYIGLDNSVDILSMGFKIKKRNYLYLTSSFNSQVRFSFPGDFFDLITQGNGGSNLNRTFDLGFGIDVIQYVDAGIGFNREIIKDKLTVGARYRWLKGLNVVHTERNKLKFRTDPETYDLTVQSDILVNMATSLVNIDSLAQLNDSNLAVNGGGYFQSPNTGSALDFGIEFRPTESWTLSAALNNLGRINWDNSSFSYGSKNPNATYTYRGIYIEDFFDSTKDYNEEAQRLLDTLEDRFQLEERSSSFTTNLFTEFYIGGQYNLSKDHNAGVLLHGSFYQDKIQPAITVSWNSKLTNLLALSASYTARSNSYTNLGIGMSLNLGPFQFYAVSDNIGGVFAPADVKNVNLRTGFNLAMQRKDLAKQAKKKADKADKKKRKAQEKANKKALKGG